MIKQPLVSVIMPLYNKAPYVKHAVESVLEQSYVHWELIIVDDGSTDNSADQITQNDSRIKLFRQENAGPASARNNGIRRASGDYVTFLDADDYYLPAKLEVEMDFLWNKKKADWMISAYEYEKENQLTFKYLRDVEGNEIKTKPLIIRNALNELQLSGVPSNGICIKRKLLESLGGFKENMHCFEITELVIRCALSEPKVAVCNQALYRVVDVHGSAYKIRSNLVEGTRQKGESLHRLSQEYPEFSRLLVSESKKNMLDYTAALILQSRQKEARTYLTRYFPYPRNMRWWKMWSGSWLPEGLLQRILRSDINVTSNNIA